MSQRASPSQIRAEAERLASNGDLAKAAALYRQFLEQKPNALDARNRLADLLDGLGKTADAIAEWRAAAEAQEQDGFIARAIGLWAKIVRRTPFDPEPRIRMADLHQQQGHIAEAGPKYLEAAELAEKAKRVDLATLAYEKALSVVPDNVVARRRLATLYLSSGRAIDALAECLRVASSLRRMGDVDGARELLAQTVQAAPASLEARLQLADLYLDQGRYDDALAVLPPAPSDTPVENRRAAAQGGLNAQRGEALVAFETIEPLVDELSSTGQLESAAALVERFVAKRKAHPRAWLKLTSLYRDLGDRSKVAWAYTELAEVHLQAGQPDLARAALEIVATVASLAPPGPAAPKPVALARAELDRLVKSAAEVLDRATAVVIAVGTAANVPQVADYRDPASFAALFPDYAAAGLTFETLARGKAFQEDPELAWGFYGQRLGTRRHSAGLPVMERLRRLATRPTQGAYVVTSSVMGLFDGVEPSRLVQCYGTLDWLQCNVNCGQAPYSAEGTRVTVGPDGRAVGPLPKCPGCGSLARPNVLMYGDWQWDTARLEEQEDGFQSWLAEVTATAGSRLVVLECAESPAVPTLRLLAERLRAQKRARLIRISTEDASVPVGEIGIPLPVGDALQRVLG